MLEDDPLLLGVALDEPDESEALELEPTVSPTEPVIAATVAGAGARSSVSVSDCSALLSVSSALSTAAEADSVAVVPDVAPASVSSALASAAFAWATATLALLSSIRASSCPLLTCSPSLT